MHVQTRLVADSRTAHLSLLDMPPEQDMITRHMVVEAGRSGDEGPWTVKTIHLRGTHIVTGEKAGATWGTTGAEPYIASAPSWVRELANHAINGDPPTAAIEVSSPTGELADAWAALHTSVAGDAAPEGTTLAERIRVLGERLDTARTAWGRCHARHRAAEDVMATTSEALRGALGSLVNVAAPGPDDEQEGVDHAG